jgi:hypothetical protein
MKVIQRTICLYSSLPIDAARFNWNRLFQLIGLLPTNVDADYTSGIGFPLTVSRKLSVKALTQRSPEDM